MDETPWFNYQKLFFSKERMNKADLIRFEKRTMYPNVLHELSEWSDMTPMNLKYSLYNIAFAGSSHLLLETPAVCILGFVPQNFISKNNLWRQHLLVIPL